MIIYFVETNANNELIAVENGKAKTFSQESGKLVGTQINLQESNAEGTLQRKKIVSELKKYLSETPLNDYDDIYSENEFNWNANEFQKVTQVY